MPRTIRAPARHNAARRVFWYAFAGVLVPCILLEVIGVLLNNVLKEGAGQLRQTGRHSSNIGDWRQSSA